MGDTADTAGRLRARRAVASLALFALLALFLAGGALGVYRYARGYWLYRGFPPPREAKTIPHGRTESFQLKSAAVGGRSQRVFVYLPPGYDSSPTRRYPVFYLLHGFPGRPQGFLLALRMGVLEDELVAARRAQPVILAMPFGSTGVFTDKEWANGVSHDDAWETFVERDVVRAIDSRYRTIPRGSARAIGGLSEGGYGALNIGFHRPGEFRVLESWSGYVKADNVKSIFGGKHALLRQNSPMHTLPAAAPALRRAHTYIWFYSGRHDKLRRQNVKFAHALAAERIGHFFFLASGGHNFKVWRDEAGPALLAASSHLAGALAPAGRRHA